MWSPLKVSCIKIQVRNFALSYLIHHQSCQVSEQLPANVAQWCTCWFIKQKVIKVGPPILMMELLYKLHYWLFYIHVNTMASQRALCVFHRGTFFGQMMLRQALKRCESSKVQKIMLVIFGWHRLLCKHRCRSGDQT